MKAYALLLAMLLPVSLPAQAKDDGFDKPLRVVTVKAAPGHEGEAASCTYYPDLMIRESGTDTPDPDDARLLALGGPAPDCTERDTGGAANLKTQGFSFIGRKAGYLVFSATDPNGAVVFQVLAAKDGRLIRQDSMVESTSDFPPPKLEGGALVLAFTRGINGTCSLLLDTKACWRTFAQTAPLPAEIAALAPPGVACAHSYRRGKATADDPSVVTYPVKMRIEPDGHTRMLSHGRLGCEPMP